MKVYNIDRDKFIKTIDEVYKGDLEKFFDDVECGSSYRFESYVTGNEEIFIINTNTGEYINWYKLTHIGRTNTMNFSPKRFKSFINDFYESNHLEEVI